MTTLLTDRLGSGIRSVRGDVYDVDDKRHQVAVSIPHERLDSYKSDFQKGAFAESFKRHLPEMLLEHNPEAHLGDAIRAEVRPSDNLLVGQFEDFAKHPLAKRTFARIRSGEIPGWSFRFTGGEVIPHPAVPKAIRYTKAQMREFSAVSQPSIPGTMTVGIRSRQSSTRAMLLDRLGIEPWYADTLSDADLANLYLEEVGHSAWQACQQYPGAGSSGSVRRQLEERFNRLSKISKKGAR